ncbi:hypothetical protein D3C74_362290 [compost metagenome]
MMNRCCVTFSECLLHKQVNDISILGMHHHKCTVFFGFLQRLKENAVIGLKLVFVSHEHLEGRYALLFNHLRQFFQHLLIHLANHQMKSIVNDSFPLGFSMPFL